jgi:hypothetical protein
MIENVVDVLKQRVEAFVADLHFFTMWIPGRVSRATSDEFLLEFDHLVGNFPPVIALAISRLDELGRVVLAKNLFQECGEGDVMRTHHAIYRKFLRSIGLDYTGRSISDATRNWSSAQHEAIGHSDPATVVGLIASGEVLAQPALTRIFAAVQPLYANADVEYFTTHLILEAAHVDEIAELISLQCATRDELTRMTGGFDQGLAIWHRWFNAMARTASA